jgi:hypothetical protein
MDRQDDAGGRFAGSSTGRSRAVRVVAALVGIEAIALGAAVVILLIDVVTLTPSSLASAIALIVLTAVAAVWVAWIAASLLRGASWSRGGALFWQLIQLTIALGAIQGAFAQPLIGAAIAVPSLAVIVLLFTRSVMQHTRRPDREL